MRDLDIANYSDIGTSYIAGHYINQVISPLQNPAASLFKWFSDNPLIANPYKCYLFINESSNK